MNTLGEKYGPAIEITDQDAADVYFDLLVKDTMAKHGMGRDAAGEQERRNLGYYAGYYKQETRKRVEKLFACSHPIFGEVARNGTPHQRRARTLGAREGLKLRLLATTTNQVG